MRFVSDLSINTAPEGRKGGVFIKQIQTQCLYFVFVCVCNECLYFPLYTDFKHKGASFIILY